MTLISSENIIDNSFKRHFALPSDLDTPALNSAGHINRRSHVQAVSSPGGQHGYDGGVHVFHIPKGFNSCEVHLREQNLNLDR